MIAAQTNSLSSGKKLKNYITPDLQPIRALFFIFFSCFFMLSAQAQKNEVDSLTQWLNKYPSNDSLKIYVLHHLSYKLSETDVDKSFSYYQRVAFLSDSLHFTYGMALADINLGILFSSGGNFEQSNAAYFKAIDLAKSCDSRRLEAVSLNNIGDNFFSLKEYEKCRKYASEAIGINIALKAWHGVAINYELLNRCDLEQGFYASAKKNLDTGMPYAIQTREPYVLSQFYNGYAKLFAIHNKSDSASFYFDKAIEVAGKNGDTRNVYQVYLAQAKYLKHITNHDKTALLSRALQLAEQTHFAEGRSTAAGELSSVYDDLKNKDSSIFYYRMFKAIRDSIFSENNRRDVIVNESEWMVKKKELEYNTLKQLTDAQKKQLEFKNILLVLSGVGFFLVLFVAVLLYKSFQTKKLRDESQYRQKIAETEMQALQAQMNPHFFFNSLNSIENFIMQNEKKLASDYLNKFARFIRSILDSSFNELVEINKDITSLQLYIDLEQLRFNNKFIYCCIIDPQLLHGEFHVPALLVQPFLENAINHGIGPSERPDLQIWVKINLQDNMIHYTIQDNGIGRDQSHIYNQLNKPFHKSVGMKLTQDRINIFNQHSDSSDSVKITDLFDDGHKPIGTRIEFAIKAVTYVNTQSHIGR
jgi:hypothetical protein